MLHRAEIIDLLILGNDHHTAGVLARGALYIHAASGQPQHLGKGHAGPSHQLQVLFRIADGRFLRHSTDGTGSEHMILSEQLKGIAVGLGLIFAGKVQIDIGYLIPAETQEGLEGNVETVLLVRGSADGAVHVRHIRSRSHGPGRSQSRCACSSDSGNGAAGRSPR